MEHLGTASPLLSVEWWEPRWGEGAESLFRSMEPDDGGLGTWPAEHPLSALEDSAGRMTMSRARVLIRFL